MSRVNVIAAVCCTAMLLMVSNANAQCASCGQAAVPSFSQSYAAPNYAAPVSYAQPAVSYFQPQASSAVPVSSGCSSCGTASFAAPQVSYDASAPISTGCSSCAGSAPVANYAQPAVVYSAPVSTACAACDTRRVGRPQVAQRIRVIGQRRGNNCSTCAPCNASY